MKSSRKRKKFRVEAGKFYSCVSRDNIIIEILATNLCSGRMSDGLTAVGLIWFRENEFVTEYFDDEGRSMTDYTALMECDPPPWRTSLSQVLAGLATVYRGK